MAHVMRTVYQVLAYLISLAVALQAAAIALSFFGLVSWIGSGGTLDKAFIESEGASFPGIAGLEFHAMVGMMVIPALALLLLISSFFTRSKSAIGWAGIAIGCVVVQVLLGFFAHGMYMVGAVHGLFAFVLFVVAGVAAYRINRKQPRHARAVEDAGADQPTAPVG